MELNVIEISYELENEEELSALFFKTENGYFIISRSKEDDKLYLELNDQSNGQYFDPDYFDFSFENGRISFFVNENRTWDLGMYQNITLTFEPVEKNKFLEMGDVVEQIFD